MSEAHHLIIPVIGETGNGKSNLINALLGEDILSVSSASNSETKLEDVELREDCIIQLNDQSLYLLDTPGFLDTQNDEITEQLVIRLIDTTNKVNGFIIVLKDRLKPIAVEQMSIFFGLFYGKIPWDQMLFIKTNVPLRDRSSDLYKQQEIKKIKEDFKIANANINLEFVDLHYDHRSNWGKQSELVKDRMSGMTRRSIELSSLGIAIRETAKHFGRGIIKSVYSIARGQFHELNGNWSSFTNWVSSKPIRDFFSSSVNVLNWIIGRFG